MRWHNLLLVFFILNFLSCSQDSSRKFEEEHINLSKLVKVVEQQGYTLMAEMDTLAGFYEFLLERKDSIQSFSSRYEFNGGAFSINPSGSDSTLSSLVILNSTNNYQEALKEVDYTNLLDSVFFNLYNKYPLIEQVYSNSKNQVSRVYPSYDAVNIVDPNIDVTEFNFYYEADLDHNPGKGSVWIPDPYIDPAGKGWILSLIHPVFREAELFAVLGIDITVDFVIQSFLDAESGNLLIVNKKGDIVAGKASAIEALSMPPLKNHVYRETIQSDNFRISDFNLFRSKSREVRKMGEAFNIQKKNHFVFEEEPYLIDAFCLPFELIDWYLIKINVKI